MADLEHNLAIALQRMADQAPPGPLDPAPIVRRVARRRRGLLAGPVALVVVALVVAGLLLTRPRDATPIGPAVASACTPLQTGSPPVWARGGFTGGGYAPFTRSRSGDVVAYVFPTRLAAPPVPGRNNKILWVVRGEPTTRDMTVTARLEGGHRVITMRVPAGPSIVNMPEAGCWRLDLQIGNRHDSVALRWS